MKRPAVLLGVQIGALTAILACLVALASLHPRRLDLTPERRFTLSPYTREILGRLAEDVRITVFYSSQTGAVRREMADLLALYHEAQPRITVRLLDLDRSPGAAKRLGATAYNTAVVEAGERRQHVDLVTEEGVTAALLAVAGTPPVAAYFVVGHGERDPRAGDERLGASEVARALSVEGFRVRVLEGVAAVPADAGLVILAGPRRDLGPVEVEALAAYLQGGGHAIFLCDPGTPPSVAGLLGRFGVELAGDLVVDDQARLFGADGRSARVAYLNQGLVTNEPEVEAMLPEAQSLRLLDAPGVRADYLAMTGEATWADVDRRAPGEARFRPGRDRRGPLPVAAFVRTGEAGRLAVIGDADFVTNLYLNVLGNRDLLLATAGLVARAEAVAAARPPGPPGGTLSPLTLTAREMWCIFWGAVVGPSGLLAAAALVMARRARSA
jgi:hypothetical protein